ncbi:ArsR/SmtB family transcription factor [Amycolatopsis sp. WGS_07]|uniref:ArsR/SmtB family transcription factor n=1 Tax=Amycolatopsis sp. WGS_07 TaxID=3076764 RepID=UPI00387377E0
MSAGASTTAIAARLGVTPAAISQHVKILREANLVTTTRLGTAVRHTRTPLAEHFLRENGWLGGEQPDPERSVI